MQPVFHARRHFGALSRSAPALGGRWKFPAHDAGSLHETHYWATYDCWDSQFQAPSSVDALYSNRFTHNKVTEGQYGNKNYAAPKEFDQFGLTTEKAPVVKSKSMLKWSDAGDPHQWFGFGNFRHEHYTWCREPVFPVKPLLEDGELASGANLMRTDVWKTDDQEPSINQIAKFSPDNFRAVGYAENAPNPAIGCPEEWLDFRSNRLPIGHADRRPALAMAASISAAVSLTVIRGCIVKAVHSMAGPNKPDYANSKIEVDISGIIPGTQLIASLGGAPVFIKRRTPAEIASAARDDALIGGMRDPQKDAERSVTPELLIISGACTHLGCVPTHGVGDWGAWFCPCHGSHYDHSGRARKGPAPKNLPVMKTKWISDTTIEIGK